LDRLKSKHRTELELEGEAYANRSLQFGREQAGRRTIETKTRDLETEVATARSKCDAEVDKITKEYNRKFENLEKDLEDANGRYVSETRVLEGKHRVYLQDKEREHEGQIKFWK
jgi:hypothetical protein